MLNRAFDNISCQNCYLHGVWKLLCSKNSSLNVLQLSWHPLCMCIYPPCKQILGVLIPSYFTIHIQTKLRTGACQDQNFNHPAIFQITWPISWVHLYFLHFVAFLCSLTLFMQLLFVGPSLCATPIYRTVVLCFLVHPAWNRTCEQGDTSILLALLNFILLLMIFVYSYCIVYFSLVHFHCTCTL